MKKIAIGLFAALCLAGAVAASVPGDALCDTQHDAVIDVVVKCHF
jgi:hypothetical protein